MASRRTVWLLAASFWALFGLISGVQIWISMRTHGHSGVRLIGYYLVIWEAWLLPTAAILWLARRFPVVPLRAVPLAVHAVSAFAVALVHESYWIALLLWWKPFDRMTPDPAQFKLKLVDELLQCLPLELAMYCLVLGFSLALDYYGRYRERAVQAAELETSLADARLYALELQIQPHFLFNTMNAITSLVRTQRNDEAVAMIAGLSELLRYTLDHSGHQRVRLGEELAVLERYLEIQRFRFPDRMTFRVDASAEVRRGTVPTLILQPLAENAVRHGIAPSASPGVVDVRAFRSEDRLRIEVFNSGKLAGSPAQGIGLSNTRERLRHLYGEGWTFDLASANGGVMASLSLPWSEST
ncbi:MAG TPA: histidine kinase [Polyangiaceae bacterium]|nr:histidine kinase [Polyangiaceae bacterium]